MKIIYSRIEKFQKTEIYIENGLAHFIHTTIWGKEAYQIQAEKLSRNVSFSRTYHPWMAIPSGYLMFLSVRLIIKKWNTGDWTLYLGLSVSAMILLLLIYYILAGRYYGEVELTFGEKKLKFLMKEHEYLHLQEKIYQDLSDF